MLPRKERRKEARQNKQEFTPLFNGHTPLTFEEYYNVGYERFNNKFITIKKCD